MRLVVFRHGERGDNIDFWSRLTPHGNRQAASIAQYWNHYSADPPTVIYCSPLIRTVETALPLALKYGVKIRLDWRLAEVYLDESDKYNYEVNARNELSFHLGYKGRHLFKGPTHQFEAKINPWQRIGNFVTDIMNKHDENANIVVFTHNGCALMIQNIIYPNLNCHFEDCNGENMFDNTEHIAAKYNTWEMGEGRVLIDTPVNLAAMALNPICIKSA